MSTITCQHCGATFELPPLAERWDPLTGRCRVCSCPLATLNTHRIPGWRLELLRDEFKRNMRGGW